MHNNHKPIQIAYATTKQTISTCYNYLCFTDCILSLNNDQVNILNCWFYWFAILTIFFNFNKAQGQHSLKMMQIHWNM